MPRKMPRLIRVRLPFSAFIVLAAFFILVLFGFVTNHEVSVNTQAGLGDNAAIPKTAVPAALVKPEVEAAITKLAIPFGNKAALHLSPPKEKPLLPFSRVKRDDVTVTWEDAVLQGHLQFNRLEGPKTESVNLNINQMEGPEGTPEGYGNGWTVDEFEDRSGTPEDYDDVFQDLQISQGPDNHFRQASQDLKFANCNFNNLNPTHGLFQSYINVQGGTMVAYASYSPAFKCDKSDPDWKMKLPRVSRMSDVLWIQWAYIAAQDGTPGKVSQLEYIFRYDIATQNTKFIIEQAAGMEEEDTIGPDEFEAEWPGYEFIPGDDRFTALLGTVHGVGIVDLLVSHPIELGTKSIESVTIFTTPGTPEDGELYHMLWTLTR